MLEVIDCSGLSCPQPVLLVLQCIKEKQPTNMKVTVDNEASHENVSRAAAHNGYAVKSTYEGTLVHMELTKQA